ncbi:MAG: glycosyltransferase family 2 protein, partial [Muribaculaceae bacterium]|nr:glycosyltransferase family 2 protein [Muribaculaceae bacterium]
MPRFSIIIPVYNRPNEVDDLLASLAKQSVKNFEVVITEDGSTIPCRDVCERYSENIDIKYYTQENTGRSPARNNSMDKATGD